MVVFGIYPFVYSYFLHGLRWWMLEQQAQRATYRALEYNVPPLWGICQDGNFCLMIGPKNTNLSEDVEILLPSSFVAFLSAVSEEKSKMSQPIRGQGGHLVFPIGLKNKNLVEDIEILLPVKFRWIPFSGFRGELREVEMSHPIRDQSDHIVFPMGPKNTNLVEDIEILLPIKFRWIPFSGFRGEVENVSTNQRPGRPSCFSDQPKTQTW